MTLVPIRAALAALLLALSLPLAAEAFEPGRAVRLDQRPLDLRRAPNHGSRVIGRPGPGAILSVLAVRGGWVQLVDPGGIYPSGWVEMRALAGLGWADDTRTAGTGEGMRLVPGTDADGRRTGQRSFRNAPFGASQAAPPPADPAPALPRPWPTAPGGAGQAPLTAEVARFDCERDSDAGQGLSGCTLRLSIGLEIPEAYAPFLKDEIALFCEASVSYTSLGAEAPRSVWEQGRTAFAIRDGIGGGTAELRFGFSLEPDPVLAAEVESVDCQPEL